MILIILSRARGIKVVRYKVDARAPGSAFWTCDKSSGLSGLRWPRAEATEEKTLSARRKEQFYWRIGIDPAREANKTLS